VRKKQKQNIYCKLFFYFIFEGNKTHLTLEMNSTKL